MVVDMYIVFGILILNGDSSLCFMVLETTMPSSVTEILLTISLHSNVTGVTYKIWLKL
jgi:hypothetical protein